MLTTGREGFTLAELIAAVAILLFGILGLATSAGVMLTAATTAETDATAVEAVSDRLAFIRMSPAYETLDSLFEGEEENVPGLHSDCTRETAVQRVEEEVEGGGILDYVKVTVTVSCPSGDPVVRTLVLGPQ
jgi:Tfp pilus assembly protein PilV